ncbi:PssD/Cps14F family polysaccharide biosynthesis glycosyltransferase [Desulfonatronospira thiodismutans]|nr:PssD/Cps14F family polysaccharide biosynthesis glycosyltransferase [Desulfonatronospira thiodismutans]
MMVNICVGASAGGHLNQLILLIDNATNWPCKPDLCVTTHQQVVGKLSNKYGNTVVLGDCNRNTILGIINVLYKSFLIAKKYKPKVIISTGSLPIAIFCLWGKIMGARIIWIDSIANIDSLSMSGKLVYRFADLFLVQWEELVSIFPKAKYSGKLI